MQKFQKGDWVQVAEHLRSSMSHFPAGCEAIVIGSYADQYGGDDYNSYTIYTKDEGSVSWYDEDQFTLIEKGRFDKLKEWQDDINAEEKQKSDLDWIFTNGLEVCNKPHGASIQALANCFGMANLWGTDGEGITYYHNSWITLEMAKPFLIIGDKSGWLEYCKK